VKRIKLLGIELFIAALLAIVATFLYLEQNSFFENFNNKIRDVFFDIRGDLNVSHNIVIVDIDEKSLRELGQWPWSRDIVAQILQNLTKAEVGIIGLDIVFAEVDKSSPSRVCKAFVQKQEILQDYDALLAETLLNTPTISGYMFDFLDTTQRGSVPNISTVIIQKNYHNKEYLPVAKGIISNIKPLQQASFSSGFFNTLPDKDAIVRSVPLLIKYKESIFPSLSLEILRLVYQTNKIIINYSQAGISSLQIGSERVQTDRFGRLMTNYYGGTKTFPYISAVDIYNNDFNKTAVEGKIVLIGTSAGGLVDLRATPLDNTFAGVEIHATVLENVLEKEYLVKPDYIDSVNILAIFVLLVLIVFMFAYFGALVSAFFSSLLLLVYFYGGYYLFVIEGLVVNIVYPLFFGVLLYMILSSLHYFLETKQKERIRKSFSKKVSLQVMEDLLQEDSKESLAVKEKEVTVYFSDIRSFTHISETLQKPTKITEFLNYYMTKMVSVIEKNRGTIDKFIGDAIMAYWNAPLDVSNHADKAVQTALEQLEQRSTIAAYTDKKYGFRLDFGVGINTGEVVVGEIGSLGRSDYTVIGDAVNLASRLEGLCKVYGVRLVLSQYTKDALREPYVFQFLDIVKVKGKDEPVAIYTVVSKGCADKEKEQELQVYESAWKLYKEGDFRAAKDTFAELSKKYDKFLYRLYLQRCEYLQKSMPENFKGIFEFTTK